MTKHYGNHLGFAVLLAFFRNWGRFSRTARNDGLNVIEQWNSANDFIFFARRGEMVSNRREGHEISMLALRLLQNCIVYIKTLVLRQVLAQPHWPGSRRPDPALLGAYQSVWPFGLDMDPRLPID